MKKISDQITRCQRTVNSFVETFFSDVIYTTQTTHNHISSVYVVSVTLKTERPFVLKFIFKLEPKAPEIYELSYDKKQNLCSVVTNWWKKSSQIKLPQKIVQTIAA